LLLRQEIVQPHYGSMVTAVRRARAAVARAVLPAVSRVGTPDVVEFGLSQFRRREGGTDPQLSG